MDLDNNNHSVFKLYYHLILTTKYRRKVLHNKNSTFLKEQFTKVSKKYNITLEEWNHDEDHIHILFKAHPNSEISKFINGYKSSSSRIVKKAFPEVKLKLWKSMFWSRSYCLLTSGGASIETIRKYIESQGE